MLNLRITIALKNDHFVGRSDFELVEKNLLFKPPVFIADLKRAIKNVT